MQADPRYAMVRLCRGFCVVLLGVVCSGCATPALNSARRDFYAGQFHAADQTLTDVHIPKKDRVLFLMERGMARQMLGNYEGSSRDFITAASRIGELEAYSVSKGGASLLTNDEVQDFTGVPYERSLLHAFTAINHLSQAHWMDSGVEARRTLEALEPVTEAGYPDDAFARYVAGLSLGVNDEPSNEALQYRLADALVPGLRIDQATGWMYPDSSNADEGPADNFVPPPRQHPDWDTELVVFVFLGRAPRGGVGHGNAALFQPSYVDIYSGDTRLGRSYTMGDTFDLSYTTEQKEAARKIAKTATRVVLKEAIAGSVESATDNEALGELVRIILIEFMEHPDTRKWETLPRWLQVARVPCPPDLASYTAVFRDGRGVVTGSLEVTQPLTRHRDTFISFCRDIQLQAVPQADQPNE